MKSILFLCVANSARSQMAEGIARSLAPRGLKVYSAGSAPSKVNRLAVQVMDEIGIDITRQESKGIDAVPWKSIDLVVTLCAEEICPILPEKVERIHWPLPDPAAAGGGRREKLGAFRRVRTELRLRIGSLLSVL
jgi:arsenate reductase